MKFLKAGYYKLFGGLYLGWAVGANDSANIFGTAVTTNSVPYRRAILLTAIFVILGSVIQGPGMYDSVKFSSAKATDALALTTTVAAAAAVNIVTIIGIPTSTSQAAIGAMMGTAILTSGIKGVDWKKFNKMLVCWIATPIGGALVAFLLMVILKPLLRPFRAAVLNRIFRVGLIVAGSYGAYTLGANNVVVTTVPYYHSGMFGPEGIRAARIAALIGGSSIALGALTYSKNVMMTIGKKITVLDPFAALIAVLSHSIALQIFTQLHVPVSSSQAIVGAVIGVGLARGISTVRFKTLIFIFSGWFLTPISSALIAFVLGKGILIFS